MIDALKNTAVRVGNVDINGTAALYDAGARFND